MLERVGLSEMREKERESKRELSSGQKENKFDDQRGEVTWKESRRGYVAAKFRPTRS